MKLSDMQRHMLTLMYRSRDKRMYPAGAQVNSCNGLVRRGLAKRTGSCDEYVSITPEGERAYLDELEKAGDA